MGEKIGVGEERSECILRGQLILHNSGVPNGKGKERESER